MISISVNPRALRLLIAMALEVRGGGIRRAPRGRLGGRFQLEANVLTLTPSKHFAPTDGTAGLTSGAVVVCRANSFTHSTLQNPAGKSPMARLPRLSVAGLPHLVEQTGHNRQSVFLDDADRQAFRDLLRQAASDQTVAIHAYCLAERRLMLLVSPREPEGLSRMMQAVARSYTRRFNLRHQRDGTLWAGRFRATVIDPDSELVAAMRHVESDAVLAGDASLPRERRCSSAAHHLGVDHDSIVSDHLRFWALGNTPFDRHAAYRDIVSQPLGDGERQRFDEAVRKGWALGPQDFLHSLGTLCGRRAVPKRPGRPRLPGPASDR